MKEGLRNTAGTFFEKESSFAAANKAKSGGISKRILLLLIRGELLASAAFPGFHSALVVACGGQAGQCMD